MWLEIQERESHTRPEREKEREHDLRRSTLATVLIRVADDAGFRMDAQMQSLWQTAESADHAMIEAFMGTGGFGLPNYSGQGQEDLGTGAAAGLELSETVLLRRLHSLVEETSLNWTYGIFWQLSASPTGEL